MYEYAALMPADFSGKVRTILGLNSSTDARASCARGAGAG
jgi:hypothetical protein